MRDRLIELIQNSKCVETWDYYNDNPMKPCPIERLADYLLENGVIVLPKKAIVSLSGNWLMLNMESNQLGEAIKRIIYYAAGKDVPNDRERD